MGFIREEFGMLPGLTLAAAGDIVRQRGGIIRVTKRDGLVIMATTDYNTTRVNVATDNDIITAVLGIG